MHFSDKDFHKEFIGKKLEIRLKISFPCTNNKHAFLHLRISCLESDMFTIPPLFVAKDHGVQNSEGTGNYN